MRASSAVTSWQIDGEAMENMTNFTKPLWTATAAMKLKDAYSLEEQL